MPDSSTGRIDDPGGSRSVYFGLEAREGAFLCTAVGAEGAVRGMKIFPAGERGMREFLRFAEGQRSSPGEAVIGLIREDDGPCPAEEELEASLRRLGFRVLRVRRGAPLPAAGGPRSAAAGRVRLSLRAARAASRLAKGPAAGPRGLEGSAGRILEEYLEQVDTGRQARERLLSTLAGDLLPRLAALAGGAGEEPSPLRSFLRRYSTPEKLRQAAPSDIRHLLGETGEPKMEARGNGPATPGGVARGGEARRWLLARCLAEDLLSLRARARTLELLGRRAATAGEHPRPMGLNSSASGSAAKGEE